MVWLDFTDSLRGQIASLMIIDKLKPAMSNVMSHKIHKDFSTAPCAIQLISKSAHGQIIPIIYPHSSLSLSRHMYLYLTSYVSYNIYIYLHLSMHLCISFFYVCLYPTPPKKSILYIYFLQNIWSSSAYFSSSRDGPHGYRQGLDDVFSSYWMRSYFADLVSTTAYTCYTVLYIREKAVNFTYDWCILYYRCTCKYMYIHIYKYMSYDYLTVI